jgi:hypothetical protein
MVLRIFRYKMEQVTRMWRKLLYEKLHNLLWRICPMRELLKRRNLEIRNNRSTSVHCSLLGNAHNSRKSSQSPPRLLLRNAAVKTSLRQLVATQQ